MSTVCMVKQVWTKLNNTVHLQYVQRGRTEIEEVQKDKQTDKQGVYRVGPSTNSYLVREGYQWEITKMAETFIG